MSGSGERSTRKRSERGCTGRIRMSGSASVCSASCSGPRSAGGSSAGCSTAGWGPLHGSCCRCSSWGSRSASGISFVFPGRPPETGRAPADQGYRSVASGKLDPMRQLTVEAIGPALKIGSFDISFTNSALFMVVTLLLIWAFMLAGMKRLLVPGRWQVMVEGLTGFIQSMVDVNIGPKGRRFTPYIFSLFSFILVANFLGLVPLAIVPGLHSFTPPSHFSITGVLAILSFSIVQLVGFAK